MKLDSSNLYIRQDGDGYIVCIEMPDKSRNYLHNEVHDLQESIWIMNDIDGDYEINDVEIIEDGKYFRLEINLTDGRGKPQTFHSRKLNLNDVVQEKKLLEN